MDRDLNWGDKHIVQCTDDVLQNCVPDACVILFTSVTAVNSIKRENIIKIHITHMYSLLINSEYASLKAVGREG